MNQEKSKIFSKQNVENKNSHPEIVLVGQPNCGKSTIFNQVSGYRSVTSNFPGATVTYTQSHVRVNKTVFDLVDLPGIYSLSCIDSASTVAQYYLLSHPIDVIINVVDASILSRSLELTLQLLELELPMVLCLNMMDEATRKGIHIDVDQLAKLLQMPVVPTIGSKGTGINSLLRKTVNMLHTGRKSVAIPISKHVRDAIENLTNEIQNSPEVKDTSFSPRLLAVKLLEEDPFFEDFMDKSNSDLRNQVDKEKSKLKKAHGQSSDLVISSERHAVAMHIFEECSSVEHAQVSWRDKIDSVLMQNVWGYVIMIATLFLFFNLVFKVGGFIEQPIISLVDRWLHHLEFQLGAETLLFNVTSGLLQGIGGGIAIVIPYLVPFLFGLAFIEDLGYLPRIAFLMDTFMHRIGLHGTSIIPVVLGYGCSVPAVMATRILESRRDRFIASVISILVPCAARMTVIFGLVGYYLGGLAALSIYLLNIFVVGITGNIMSKLMPEDSPGMALEIPTYHIPSLKVVLNKTWLRLKDFIIVAWPLLIIGSLFLSLAEYYHFDDAFNKIVSPLTSLLGLPAAVGTTLLFGVLRKELSMLMLFQALGVTDVSTVLTSGQILVFTIFIVFYVPCLATVGVMNREIGWKRTLEASAFTIILATTLALLTRGFAAIFL